VAKCGRHAPRSGPLRLVTALAVTFRRFGEARICRRVAVASGVAIVVVAIVALATDTGWRPVVEVALLVVGGTGSLLAHEFAHGFVHQLLCPGRSWAVQAGGASLSVVIERPVYGLARAAIAAAGPTTGALAAVLPMGLSSSSGVFVLLGVVHLSMLAPHASDGRQLVAGVREAAHRRPD